MDVGWAMYAPTLLIQALQMVLVCATDASCVRHMLDPIKEKESNEHFGHTHPAPHTDADSRMKAEENDRSKNV